jgi:hypothetical protein
MVETYVINHQVEKENEGRYYTIDFQVPDGVERVSVSYQYAKKPDVCVDLGLMDANGKFLGWSGSARDTVFVSPGASTKGYLRTDIGMGTWRILVGAYKIPKKGLSVRYEIVFSPKQARWLTGDLHMHSDASDGQHDIPTLIGKAKELGLDFIAISNHNNYSENLNLPQVENFSLIPAVEWTHYRGHMNFFGVPSPFENTFVANSEQDMLNLVAHAKSLGAVISVNHPKCDICPYLWDSEDCFDLVEVWNGPMRKVNLNAIAWWHKMLMAGKKKPLVGGSDFHRDKHPVRMAHPVTRVLAESNSPTDILNAITQGHSYVTASVTGVQLDLRCSRNVMGDTVKWEKGTSLSVSSTGGYSGLQLQLITSEGIAQEWSYPRKENIQETVAVESSWRFAYLVASYRVLGTQSVRAISNPIYFTF